MVFLIGIYARQSVDKKDSISIETQIALCRREADSEEVKIYADKGYSGSNMHRPGFQHLLEDIRQGRISKVIIYRLDRMSRSLLDFSKLIELFRSYGVEFQSTQEKFDTSTPIGNAMLSITMVFAQLERETIQQRIKDNYYARGKQGAFLGGTVPFGFQRSEKMVAGKKIKVLQADEQQISHLIRIFRLYADEGLTLGEIARSLNQEGITSPGGRNWNSDRIGMILRNPVYVKADATTFQYFQGRGCKMLNDVSQFVFENGCLLFGKRDRNRRKYMDITDHTLTLALHQGIVEPELFLKCQERLDANCQIDNGERGKHSWLTGLVKCGKCGYGLAVKTSHHSQYRYLNCTARLRGSCDARFSAVKVEKLEQIVRLRLFQTIQQNTDLLALEKPKRPEKEHKIKAELVKKRQQINRTITFCLESTDISSRYLNEKLEELNREKTMLEDQLGQMHSTDGSQLQKKQLSHVISDWESLSNHQKKELAALFIQKILLKENGDLQIFWKYNFLSKEAAAYPDYSNCVQ